MWQKLRKLGSMIREGLWFLPAVILAASVLLAYGALNLDLKYDPLITERFPRLFAVSESGAYSILSAIASSMVTVAGVTFSITVVALSLAANQYSPRTLRNYMRDRWSQLTLGVFAGSFAYALVVLRMIRGEPDSFVPSIAVLGGILLAIVSVGLFIYFVHHIAVSLTASHFVSTIADETRATLDKLYRGKDARAGRGDEDVAAGEGEWHDVPALETGYLQTLDRDALLRFAARHDLVLAVACEVGTFIVRSEPILRCRGARPPGDPGIAELNRMFVLMGFRTIHQDPEYGVRQIVDVALKALSPGINDTATAMTCVDYLGAVLLPFCDCQDPGNRHYLDGALRVITCEITFSGLLEQAIDPIVSNSPGNAEILERILSVLDRIHYRVTREDRIATLREMVYRIREAALSEIRLQHDRARIGDRTLRLLRGWEGAGSQVQSGEGGGQPA